MRTSSRCFVLLAASFVPWFAPPASAQGFGNEWVAFERDDARLIADPAVGLDDPEQKDYAAADLDRDGWTDLVCVRKEPWVTGGLRRNVLFMNESGVLVDRTALHVASSTVPGDGGFLTPTNDRDVVIVDVDLDGWLDVVTAPCWSGGEPVHVSHPRVYVNQGLDPNGDWRGLLYDAARIPTLLQHGTGVPVAPRFFCVAAGDVTGDGFPDLYFGDHEPWPEQPPVVGDRLLVNDGHGRFEDQTLARSTPEMIGSQTALACELRDLNQDGVVDVLRDNGSPGNIISVAYNDPGNEGYFDLFQGFSTGTPYFVSTGDLNDDGRSDLVISDDHTDHYYVNEGNDALGRVIWSSPTFFEHLSGSDDGYGANSYSVDLDRDGWLDVLICDVDAMFDGCTRRLHVYHHTGVDVSGDFALREEAQQAGNGGWKGVVGMLAADLQGTHDVAVLDIDNDGNLDLVLGRCDGTDVWMNTKSSVGVPLCLGNGSGPDCPCGNEAANVGAGCANGTGVGALLAGEGEASVAQDSLVLTASALVPAQAGVYFQGDVALGGGEGVPFGGGLRCAGGHVVRLETRVADAAGASHTTLPIAAAGAVQPGDTRYYQLYYRDPAASCGASFNATNGLAVFWH